MSHSRDDSVRNDADRMAPTVPIRRGDVRPPSGDGTDPVPVSAPPKSVNRITPHLNPPSTPLTVGSSLYRRGQRIGDYEIIEELARGGMGVIYKAQQVGLKRIVALKMVLRGDFARFEELVRFRTEAHAIARLHHPNLVNIFEIGEHDGLPFYAMEYLEGGTLAYRIDRKQMGPCAAARLMLPLAQAIDYAHSRGIIHRDLKPANILLTSPNPSLDKNIAKISDFGIAKQIGEDAKLTRTGEILGTPAYMAPEQATGRSADAGPAADVYSLGAILYETLTGRAPFVGSDPADTLLQMLSNEPVSPRKLNSKVSADLETICLKCLEKDPAKRYQSAGLLAEDLRRYLADEPILARPSPITQRLRKWVRRRPVQATMLAATALLVVLGIGAIVTFWQQAVATAKVEADMVKTKENNLIEVKSLLADAKALLADALLERGIALAEKNDVRRGMHWMIRSLDVAESIADGDPKSAALAEAVRYNLAHWGNLAAPPEKLLPHKDWAWAVAFSPDGKTAFTGGRDGRFCAGDAATGEMRGQPHQFDGPLSSVAAHSGGRFVFVAGASRGGLGEIRVYQKLPAPGSPFEQVGPRIVVPAYVRKIILSPDGRHLLALDNSDKVPPHQIASGGAILYAFDPLAEQPLSVLASVASGGFRFAEFSHDSKKIFLASAGEVHTYEIGGQSFVPPAWSPDNDHEITAMTMTADRQMLAVSVWDVPNIASRIDLWRVNQGNSHLRAHNVPGKTKVLAFSPDGRYLAVSSILHGGGSGDISGQVRVAEVHFISDRVGKDFNGKNIVKTHDLYGPQTHARPVWAIEFHPSGKYYATGGEDGSSRLWDTATGQPISLPLKHEGTVPNVAFNRQGTHLLTASAGGDPSANARLSELPSFAALPVLYTKSAVHGIAWENDGRHFIVQDQSQQYSRWDSKSRTKVSDIPLYKKDLHFSSKGIARDYNPNLRRITLYDCGTGKKLNDLPDFDLHPSDAWLNVVAGHHPLYNRETKTLSTYRIADNTPRAAASDLPGIPTGAFGHQKLGRHGAIFNKAPGEGGAEKGSEVRVWDLDMKQLAAFKLPNRSHNGLFNGAGDIVAVRGDYQFQFFNVETGEKIYRAISHEGRAFGCVFHPSSNLLLFAGAQGQISCWHVPSAKSIGKQPDLNVHPMFISPRPDGSGYFAGGRDLHIIEWPHIGPKTESVPWLKTWVENLTGMTFDDNDELSPMDGAVLAARRQSAQ